MVKIPGRHLHRYRLGLRQAAAMAGNTASQPWNVAVVLAPALDCEIAEVGLLNADGSWTDAYLGAPSVMYGGVIGVRAKGRNKSNIKSMCYLDITLYAPDGTNLGTSTQWSGYVAPNGITGYTQITVNTSSVGQPGTYKCVVEMFVEP